MDRMLTSHTEKLTLIEYGNSHMTRHNARTQFANSISFDVNVRHRRLHTSHVYEYLVSTVACGAIQLMRDSFVSAASTDIDVAQSTHFFARSSEHSQGHEHERRSL